MWSGLRPWQTFYFKVDEAEFPGVVVKEEDATLSESSRLSLADTQSRYAQLYIALSRVGFSQSQLSILILNEDFKQLSGCVKVQINLFLLGFYDPMLGSRLAGNRPYRGQGGEEERLGCTLVTSFNRGWKVSSAIVKRGFESTLNSHIFLISQPPPYDVIVVHVVRFIHAERVRQIELTTENQFQKSTT